MDAVILAAGRGSRLAGVTPPFYKPLMVVNGKALIASAIQQAQAHGAGRVIVVAAPENAVPLSHFVGHGLDEWMIIQTAPRGPGDALHRGLELALSDHVLVLMGDNVFGDHDISRCVERGANIVGVRDLQRVEPFTRRRRDGTWVEKVPAVQHLDFDEQGRSQCWVGPLLLRTQQIKRALYAVWPAEAEAEWPIGPALNHIPDLRTIEVETYDIGSPEELT